MAKKKRRPRRSAAVRAKRALAALRRFRRRAKDLELACYYYSKEVSRLNGIIADLNPSHYADGM